MSDTPQAEAPPPRHPLLGELIVIPPRARGRGRRRPHAALEQQPQALGPRRVLAHPGRRPRDHPPGTPPPARDRPPPRPGPRRRRRPGTSGTATRPRPSLATLGRHPARVLAELRRSMHGCEALARRWETLLATLDARGSWTDGLRAHGPEPAGRRGRVARGPHPAWTPPPAPTRSPTSATVAAAEIRPPPRPRRRPGPGRRPRARGPAPGPRPRHPRPLRASQGGGAPPTAAWPGAARSSSPPA